MDCVGAAAGRRTESGEAQGVRGGVVEFTPHPFPLPR